MTARSPPTKVSTPRLGDAGPSAPTEILTAVTESLAAFVDLDVMVTMWPHAYMTVADSSDQGDPMDPAHVVEAYFKFLPILIGVSVLWTGGWVWASVAYRRSRGKPIVFTGVEGADYVETAASGHSHRTWYTRLGGANRVLVVAVAGGRLIIRPRFPFNLLFLPEVYGLEYEVPVHQITSVQPREGRSGRVDVQFRDATNGLQSVTLYLRDRDRFTESLRKP